MRATRALAAVAACAAAACDPAPGLGTTRAALLGEELAIPSDVDLARELADALLVKRRADAERAVDALEPGEQLSHATLPQFALDTGAFTLDDLFLRGDDLFAYTFRTEQGLGNALAGRPGILAGGAPAPNLRRVHQGAFGGPDAAACADCHSVAGDDGAGAPTQNAYLAGDGDRTLAADVRNPPMLLGGGPLELLAAEMSAALAGQRAAAIAAAQAAGGPVARALTAKGLGFGTLVARPDGSVDTSGVTGVAPDLIVRPFGWKGHLATLREAVKEAFRIHLGIVPMADQQAVRDGRLAAAAIGDGPWFDVDRDGVNIELDDGMVTTMVAYLAMLEVPVVRPPDDPTLQEAFARGRAAFDRARCAGCHVPALTLDEPVLVTRPEQTEHAASAPVVVDVARDGLTPKIEPVDLPGSAHVVRLFSDLRRHDLGPALAAPFPHEPLAIAGVPTGGAVPARLWLTRPLWGLADTAPYLHDGRAPTIDDAIRLHGGEATASRDAYAALPDDERAALLVFLTSLQRTRRVVIR